MRKIMNEDKADNRDKETGGKQRERANIEMRQVGYGKDQYQRRRTQKSKRGDTRKTAVVGRLGEATGGDSQKM